MSTENQEKASNERVQRLLQLFMQILPKLRPSDMGPFLKGLDRMPPRFSPHLVAEPPTMHRMASMLYGDPKPTMGDLSRDLSLPPSTVTRVINMLEEQGFAKRVPDAEDARVVRVDLTDVGRRIHEAMEAHAVQSARSILECLTPEEQIILLTLLGKVASSLNKGTQ
ncbi:MAG: MarR family transcriptional regulator [Dehalococcoidia bacterium]|nr:MarR family transcriptional regulator [Dehalococcoidia bacterium]